MTVSEASLKLATFRRAGLLPEPVSPELVLIDPELARRERARLEEKAYLETLLDVAPIRRALERQPPPVEDTARRWRDAADTFRRRLVPAALMCSLLVNGFLVADLVARNGDEAAHVAVRIVTSREITQAVSSSAVSTGEPAPSPTTRTSTTVLSTKGAVERRVVSLILAAPAGKLPHAFIDPTTGLVKNNVQVVCGRRQLRSFLCVVRLPSDRTSKALYVGYRVAKPGQGVFKWYGYGRGQRSS
jgi:hypothetical protein